MLEIWYEQCLFSFVLSLFIERLSYHSSCAPNGTNFNSVIQVRVYGTVDEHYGETQIKEVTLVEVVSSNNPLPSAATITLPTSGITKNGNGAYQPDLEAYEGK
jgi:hypothetical protein